MKRAQVEKVRAARQALVKNNRSSRRSVQNKQKVATVERQRIRAKKAGNSSRVHAATEAKEGTRSGRIAGIRAAEMELRKG